ncbi:hypothetical protein [Arthrobacter woluwensis]|uniref:hypothetical protein n=1 Tax=Arthrobacter woluwensis TaxID=156980 RepID=UPI0011A61332|nr:hypothetical protein [Arthrobacter woluwensis]
MIRYLGGKLTASDPSKLTHDYDLLTFGETGRTSAGTLTAAAGVITVPAGPLPVNDEHAPAAPVGSMAVTETPEKLTASVTFFDTPAGRTAYSDASAGKKAGISVEVENIVVRAGKLLAGLLTGAGVVKAPAFPSSVLTAADAAPVPDQGEVQPELSDAADAVDNAEEQDANGDPAVTAEAIDAAIEALNAAKDQITPTPETETPSMTASAPASTNALLANLANLLGAPDGDGKLTASEEKPKGLSLEQFCQTVHTIKSGVMQGAKLTAALTTVTQEDIFDPASVPAYIGELWDGIEYADRWADLVTHDDLTAMTYKGWEWKDGPGPIVDDWDPAYTQGDPDATPPTESQMNPIPTAAVHAVSREWTAKRIAGGNRFDRIYVDFPAPGQMESYLREQADYVKRRRDARVRDHLLAVASPVVGTGADISTTWRRIILGAQHVLEDAMPSYAVIGNDIYRDLLGSDMLENLALLETSLGMKEGTLAGFKIRSASITDTGMNGRVIVGSGKVTHLHEPAGGLIRVDAQELANGAVDKAVFGYYLLRTNLIDKAGDPLNGKARRGIVEVKA